MKNCVFALSLCALLCAVPAAAQETAGIVGEVYDQAGSAIPGAHVTVTSIEKGLVARELTTGSDGAFVATLLPVGPYSVKVEAKGFKASVRNDIVLHADDKVTVRFDMQVGAVSDTVTVEASAVNIELQSPTVGSLISGNEVRELSLDNRNYIQLISLVPGVSSNAATDELYIGTTNPIGSTNTIPFAINGGRTSGNSYMVDGADNVDRGSNLTLLNTPSVDSIEEVKILRGTYSAEYGRSSTGQINVVTKSGTDAFHGSAYEFFRNDKLAANNFFNNLHNIARPPLRYNDFGYTIGGPIPYGDRSRTTNKTFFFWSEEFRRVITYSTAQSTVPTAAMKQGIFPTPVCVQRSGNTCLQTSTTIANIDPIAKEYIQDVFSKVPSSDATSNSLFSPFRSIYNARQELIKIDHQFSPKYSFFVRFVSDAIPTQEPGGLFTGAVIPGVSTTSTNSPGRNWSVRQTSTLTPTLYNEIGFAYSYGAIVSDPIGYDSKAASPDVNVTLPYPVTLARIPALTFSGGSSMTGYGPYRDYNRNVNIYDNLIWTKGKHVLKTGVTVNFYQKTENTAGNNVGTFAFTPAVTPTGTTTFRQAWANFLLGDVATFTQASEDITPNMHQFQWEAYFQDDYRVARNLTVNLGVRFSQFYSPYDSNKQLDNFDPALYNPATAPKIDASGNLIPGSGNTADGIIVNGQNSPYGNKVSNQDLNKWAPRAGFAWDPFGKGRTAVRGGYGISYDSTLVGIYEQNIFADPPFVNNVTFSNTSFANPTAGTSPAAAVKSIHATPLPYLTPYTQQWSFDIQQQFGANTILSVGYVGSKGTHLLGEVELDSLQPGAAVAAGITTANAPLTSATTPKVNGIRPYLGYNSIAQLENWFNSNYHSLQVSFRRQFGAHGTFNTAYTWGKTLTDNSSDRSNSVQNFYARNLEYARATFDRTHVVTFSYYYAFPWGKSLPIAARAICTGWQFSGITTFQTGLPLTVTSSVGVDWGDLGIIGPSPSSLRPDMVANPNANAPHTIAQWFNTAAYAAVPAGQVRPGNASPRDVIGPGIERWDLSLFRNFAIKERMKMQFRFETFNTFNHTNFLAVTTALGSSTYGQVTSAREPRRVQLGLKLSF